MAATASAPPYRITADDKSGLLVVTSAIVLAYVWTCFLIRLWLRWQTREWRADDWALTVATFLNTAQSGVVFHLVDMGVGATLQELSQPQLDQVGKQGFAAQLLYIYVLCASKLSVLLLYLRLAPGGSPRIASWVLVAASIAWALMATVLIATPCNPFQASQKGTVCTNMWPKWQTIVGLDIATETIIFAIAVQLVWRLQMRTKAKFLVVLAFSARLPVIAIASIRLSYLWQTLAGTSNTSQYVVATQWQMGYAIMSSTITGMGPFLRPFTQDYTPNNSNYKHSTYGHSSQRSTQPTHSTQDYSNTAVTASASASAHNHHHRRASWRSQTYLMEPLPSHQSSKPPSTTSIDLITPTPSTPTQSPPAPRTFPPNPIPHYHHQHTHTAPTILTADDEFQPSHCFRRHEAEVWVGSRSLSISREEGAISPPFGRDRDRERDRERERERMVVSKKTEFRVDVGLR